MQEQPYIGQLTQAGNGSTDCCDDLTRVKGQRNILSVLSILMLLYVIHLNKKNLDIRSNLEHLQPKADKLEKLNESKDQLFSVVAHDLRSAVYILQINVSKIKNYLFQGLGDEAVSLAGDTEQVIGTTQSLLNNLLYWSLSQTGQISHQPEKVPLQPLIDQVCYDFLPIAASKKLVLHLKLTPGLYCTIDVNSIKIVLRNLLDNAIKYTPEKGIIILSAWQYERRCLVTVQDTGIGMSTDVLDALAANESGRIQQDTYGKRGTGIGLWLAKSMIEKNEGQLTITSVKGIGTTITLSLPVDVMVLSEQ